MQYFGFYYKIIIKCNKDGEAMNLKRFGAK